MNEYSLISYLSNNHITDARLFNLTGVTPYANLQGPY
jgi:hypothetical protein